MRHILLLMGTLAVLLSGCGAKHYTVKSDRGIHLYLDIPGATTVLFASSLDEYALHAASRVKDSTWEITVSGGRAFAYFYVVDGKVFLPACRFHENDNFGSRNCIYGWAL